MVSTELSAERRAEIEAHRRIVEDCLSIPDADDPDGIVDRIMIRDVDDLLSAYDGMTRERDLLEETARRLAAERDAAVADAERLDAMATLDWQEVGAIASEIEPHADEGNIYTLRLAIDIARGLLPRPWEHDQTCASCDMQPLLPDEERRGLCHACGAYYAVHAKLPDAATLAEWKRSDAARATAGRDTR